MCSNVHNTTRSKMAKTAMIVMLHLLSSNRLAGVVVVVEYEQYGSI